MYAYLYIYIYICSEYLRIRFWRVWWWPSQVTLRPWTAATISLKLSESWLGVRPPCGIIWLSSFSSIAWVRFTIFIYYNIYMYLFIYISIDSSQKSDSTIVTYAEIMECISGGELFTHLRRARDLSAALGRGEMSWSWKLRGMSSRNIGCNKS